ncbi:MAG TPA: PH domain-containing protein [Flavobacterium sp.]|jgi:hypothetical protein
MNFKASLDNTARAVTGAITVLFLSIIFVPLLNHDDGGFHIVISLFLFIVYGISYGLHPAGYIIENEKLIVKRPALNVVILRDMIVSAQLPEPKTVTRALRTFGVGGLFGYYGQFYNSMFNTMTWYLTRTDRVVLLTLSDGKKIVISPDEPEAFIEALLV